MSFSATYPAARATSSRHSDTGTGRRGHSGRHGRRRRRRRHTSTGTRTRSRT